jgi:hypothetical protein
MLPADTGRTTLHSMPGFASAPSSRTDTGAGLELRLLVAPTLARIALDGHATLDELLGDVDYDDLPELAAW